MYIAIAVVVILIVILAIIYNSILSKYNKLKKAYASLDVMLKKRYDLIPNIVESVKGYKNYEAETLEKIISLRKKADTDMDAKDCNNTASEYNSFMTDINLLREQYPDLKANENFIHLQKVLNEVEEQISAARRTYNAHVESYNTFISFFPVVLFAPIFGFRKCDYFEATEIERQNVEVNI